MNKHLGQEKNYSIQRQKNCFRNYIRYNTFYAYRTNLLFGLRYHLNVTNI